METRCVPFVSVTSCCGLPEVRVKVSLSTFTTTSTGLMMLKSSLFMLYSVKGFPSASNLMRAGFSSFVGAYAIGFTSEGAEHLLFLW